MKRLQAALCTLLVVSIVLVSLSCGSPSGPSNEAPVQDTTSITGSWKFADDSDWWVVKSDGSFTSKNFTGSWTAENEKFTLYCSTELVNGVRIGYSGTHTWYYDGIDGKLFKDATPFLRVSGDSGLTRIIERVEYRDAMSAFIKVQVEISAGPDKLVYRMYANTDNDYDEETGTGTWMSVRMLPM